MPKRRINIFCSHFPPHRGGVERFADLQSRALAGLGFEVNVVTHDTEGLGFRESLNDVRIFRLRRVGLLNDRLPLPVSIFQLWAVYRDCFQLKPSLCIVHGRYYPLSLIGAVFARLSGSELVLIDHSSDYIQLNSRFLSCIAKLYEQIFTRMIMLFRPKVFGVAEACNRWLTRFGIQSAGTCYNGIAIPPTEAPLEDIRAKHQLGSRRIILAVGRLMPQKGVGELLKCFDREPELGERYALIIIGYGELEAEIRQACERHSSIIFLGRQPPEIVLAYMKQSDIFANPSNYPEGLPTTLLEAGCYGLVVITTPNGGASEVVKDGETGIIIQRGEEVQIRSALRALDERGADGIQMGERLKELVHARFCFENITRKFVDDVLRIET